MVSESDHKTEGEGVRKVNKIVGYIATFSVTLIFSLGASMYNDLKTRTGTLEERVSYLYTDKISRSEFNEVVQQLKMQNEANKADIINRQMQMRDDVLSRVDLIMKMMEKK